MTQTKKKLGKSEVSLIKAYCSRLSDEHLQILSQLLPQQIIGDRSEACEILQQDKEIDKWLSQASSAEDWFSKADSIGESSLLEIEARNSKKKN